MIAPSSWMSLNPSTMASATASGRPGISSGLIPISGVGEIEDPHAPIARDDGQRLVGQVALGV